MRHEQQAPSRFAVIIYVAGILLTGLMGLGAGIGLAGLLAPYFRGRQ